MKKKKIERLIARAVAEALARAPKSEKREAMKIAPGMSRRSTALALDPREIFRPSQPAPGVVPAGEPTMAMDEGFTLSSAWAGQIFAAAASQGLTFMGYPFLAELFQRPEYRVMSETIAEEMTRKWVKIKASGDEEEKSDKIKAIEGEFKRLHVREAFRHAAELDGAFGRGHIFIDAGIDDRAEIQTPIGNGRNAASRAKVVKGTVLRLSVVEPVWTYPTDYNSNDPLSPNWYKPRSWFVNGKRVDESRLLVFVSRPVPDLFKPAYQFGGLSMTQMAKPYVDNWIRTRQAVADLVFNFSTNVLKTNMQSVMQGGGTESLFARADIFADARSNHGLMMLDKDAEEFANVSVPLSGLDHLQAQAQEHMSSVSRIPLVKLLGISPSGLNASSEGEIEVFDDYIHAMQEKMFADNLNVILGFVQLALFGEIDPEIVFEFLPLAEMTEKEKAELRAIEAKTDIDLITEGVISPQEARQRVADDPDTPYSGLDVNVMPVPPAQPGDMPGAEGNEGGMGLASHGDWSKAFGKPAAAF